ncbi:structural toxin protein RtxA, partial [Kineobactrum sediminis]
TSIAAGTVAYSYTLDGATNGDDTSDNFAIVVTDADGDAANGSLVINIIDDEPTAADDTALVAAGSFDPVSGNVFAANDQGVEDVAGADGAAVSGVALGDTGTALNNAATVGTDIQGQYGTRTIDADGSYSYARDAGTPGGVDDAFTYTLRDADGDTSTATLIVSLGNSDVTVNLPSVEDTGTSVSEAGLPAGSDAAADSETTTGSFSFTAEDGPAVITINDATVAEGDSVTGTYG